MIKIISFDIGGTILTSKSINDYNLKKLTELINMPYEDVRIAYKNVFQKKKGSLNELVEIFCNSLDINVNSDILNFFKEKFSENNNIFCVDKNIEVIMEKLKQKGFKIILFSNSCCLIKNNFKKELLNNVDHIFYSYDIGYTKDEEESYRIIEKKLNCDPKEILHIGDTLSSDYIMPRKNGWNALFYGNSDDSTISTINNLEDIVDIIWGDLELWKEIEYLKKSKSI